MYAYVGNDPLNYWDPDGLSLDPASRVAITLAASGKGAAEIAETLVMLGLKKGPQAAREAAKAIGKNAKKVNQKELEKRVGDIHDFKENLIKDFRKELGKNKNCDIFVDKAGNIVLKGRVDGKIVPTSIPLPK